MMIYKVSTEGKLHSKKLLALEYQKKTSKVKATQPQPIPTRLASSVTQFKERMSVQLVVRSIIPFLSTYTFTLLRIQ